jgi:hypothetical protein
MANPTVNAEPLVIGRLRIPAENVEEWRRVGEEIQGFIEAGNPVPKSLMKRSYILQGMSEADAEWFSEHGEMGESNDTREVD